MALNLWWSSDGGERHWMEVTDRPVLGEDLLAPCAPTTAFPTLRARPVVARRWPAEEKECRTGEGPGRENLPTTWTLSSERVTGIKPALSAWEPYKIP
jgi:hypothetical protein